MVSMVRRYTAITEHDECYEGWGRSEGDFLNKLASEIGRDTKAHVFLYGSEPCVLSYEDIEAIRQQWPTDWQSHMQAIDQFLVRYV